MLTLDNQVVPTTPVYANADGTAIDLHGVKFLELAEMMAYTARVDDPDQRSIGRVLFARAKNGDFGAIAAYVAPVIPFYPPAVQQECQSRIYAIASTNCQMNMTAYIASGGASDADKAAFLSALTWVSAMRAECLALINAQDKTFSDDAHWPAVPSDAAALAARF